MHQIVRRTVGMTAALATAAVLAAGCGDDDKTDDAAKSASALASSASAAVGSAQASAGQLTESAKSAIPGMPGMPGAPGETKTKTADGKDVSISGAIYTKFAALTDAQKTALGAPKDAEVGIDNANGKGKFQEFAGGVIVSKEGGNAYIVWGKIRDAWNADPKSQKDGKGGSSGPLGFPTSDEKDDSAVPGGKVSTFDHGKITWDGKAETAVVTPA